MRKSKQCDRYISRSLLGQASEDESVSLKSRIYCRHSVLILLLNVIIESGKDPQIRGPTRRPSQLLPAPRQYARREERVVHFF